MTGITPPKRLHKIAIYHDGKLLILKRSTLNAYFPEFWGLPTAISDEDETDPTAEEITQTIHSQYNLALTGLTFVKNFEITLPDGYEEKIAVYDAETEGTDVKIDAKHTEYRWVSLQELAHYPILPSLEQYLRHNREANTDNPSFSNQ